MSVNQYWLSEVIMRIGDDEFPHPIEGPVRETDDEADEFIPDYFNEEAELKLSQLMMTYVHHVDDPNEAFQRWYLETFNSGHFIPNDDPYARYKSFYAWFSATYYRISDTIAHHRIIGTYDHAYPIVAEYMSEADPNGETSDKQESTPLLAGDSGTAYVENKESDNDTTIGKESSSKSPQELGTKHSSIYLSADEALQKWYLSINVPVDVRSRPTVEAMRKILNHPESDAILKYPPPAIRALLVAACNTSSTPVATPAPVSTSRDQNPAESRYPLTFKAYTQLHLLGKDILKEKMPMGDILAMEVNLRGEAYVEAIEAKLDNQAEEIQRQKEEITKSKISCSEMLDDVKKMKSANLDKNDTIEALSAIITTHVVERNSLESAHIHDRKIVQAELRGLRKMALRCRGLGYILGGMLAFTLLFVTWMISKWVDCMQTKDAK